MVECKSNQQGNCPVCNELISDYGVSEICDDQIGYPYACPCGFEGIEWYNLVFATHVAKDNTEIVLD